MTQTSRVTFHRVHPPYYPGDVAGLPTATAKALEARGVLVIAKPAVDFATLDRAALVEYAREHLGVLEEPPESVGDDELRDALRAALQPSDTPVVVATATWDQLDALDRIHLEAFAKVKCKMGDIDPALSDDELRAQIRAVAAATLSGCAAPESAAPKGGKRK